MMTWERPSKKASKVFGVVAVSSIFTMRWNLPMLFAWVALPMQLSNAARCSVLHWRHFFMSCTQSPSTTVIQVFRTDMQEPKQPLSPASLTLETYFSWHVWHKRLGTSPFSTWKGAASSFSFFVIWSITGKTSVMAKGRKSCGSLGSLFMRESGMANTGNTSAARIGATFRNIYIGISSFFGPSHFVLRPDMRIRLFSCAAFGISSTVRFSVASSSTKTLLRIAVKVSTWSSRAFWIAFSDVLTSTPTSAALYLVRGFIALNMDPCKMWRSWGLTADHDMPAIRLVALISGEACFSTTLVALARESWT
mmetsp:Transcript_112550/g.350826  ORF Transcript_112550/g.350826 Transcript_112550/m.350826 type:complete len:308 (-) Transcript_112550:357-1280(-)